MNLYYITSVLFFVWIIRNILYWVYLWQLKEYRFDRILIHLRETNQGKELLFSKLSILKLIAITSIIFIILNPKLIFIYQLLVMLIFTGDVIKVGKETANHLIKIPAFTFKAAVISGVTISFILVSYMVPLIKDGFLWMLLLDKMSILLIGLLIYLFSFPTEFYRDFKIEKAMKIIKKHNKILVIAVTGSYGKSLTKEYAAQILSEKFNVLRTKGTNNTPIGIAETIIAGLKDETEIFVCEMGAYNIGEIQEMCSIVHPKIGILTGISNQHLSLFKTIENTATAKYELIKSLPKDGISLFNGQNKSTFKLFNKTKRNKIIYKVYDNDNPTITNQEIAAYNLVFGKNYIQFDVRIGSEVIQGLKTFLLGKHNVEDILPGIYLANYQGMNNSEIKKAVLLLKPIAKTMVYSTSSKGISVINDTFNASPDAVKAALDYIKIYKGKKILVLQPMIELGKMAKEEHYLLGKTISKICDFLLLTNYNFYNEISKGISENDSKCRLLVGNSAFLSEILDAEAKKGDVIIFEGKEAAFVLDRYCLDS